LAGLVWMMGLTADSKVNTPMIRVTKRRDGGTIKYLRWRRGYITLNQ